MYCADPEHWHAVGLDTALVVAGIAAHNARKAALQAARVKVNELMDSARIEKESADRVEREQRATQGAIEHERREVEEWLEHERDAAPDPQGEADIRSLLAWLDESPPKL